MRHYGVTAIIALGTIWLSVVAFKRGQFWIGVCLVGIAVLRAVSVLSKRKPMTDPGSRLDLDNPHEGDQEEDVNNHNRKP